MILHILRALFVLLMAGVGWFFIGDAKQPFFSWMTFILTVATAVLFVAIDIASPRKKLAVLAGSFFGLLVGLVMAYSLSLVTQLIVDLYVKEARPGQNAAMVRYLNTVIGIGCCYFAISFILQTKDDFRFIIPYVEFSRQVRGARPMIVDTSVIIDGRILDICSTGIIDTRLIVPRFVLNELQTIADNGDKLKRNRGRRGLDVLNKLQAAQKVEVIVYDWTGHSSPDAEGTDQKLLVLAKEVNGRVLTNDVNLSKVAQVRGVEAININDLANAMRPVVLPGERLRLKLVKPGEDASQGVGFLEDGTMVVVEQGRGHIGEDVEIVVTNMLQTTTGRMIFGRQPEVQAGARRPRPRAEGQSSPA